jgi:hypothetical protein
VLVATPRSARKDEGSSVKSCLLFAPAPASLLTNPGREVIDRHLMIDPGLARISFGHTGRGAASPGVACQAREMAETAGPLGPAWW